MQRRYLLLMLCLFTAVHAQKTAPQTTTLTDLPPRPFATDVVLFCIDPGEPTENEFGAITAPLGGALWGKTNIIITTAGLMADIVRLNRKFQAKDSKENIAYQPSEWENFYLANAPDIYVLIPKSYAPSRTINRALGEDFTYGLHMSRLRKIGDAEMASPDFHAKHRGDEDGLSARLVPGIEKLFVTKREWGSALAAQGITGLEHTQQYLPIHAFYIVGHGAQFTSIDQEIVEITKLAQEEGKKKWVETLRYLTTLKGKRTLYAPESRGILAGIEGAYFERLLNFFSKQLFTALAFYDTCHGGGWNLEELLEKAAYAFVLISGAIMAAELLGFGTPKEFNFAAFTRQLTAYDPIDFRTLLSTIYLFADTDKSAKKASNIPLIVFPGQKAVPLDLPGQVVSIGKILAENRNPAEPLTISTFFAGRYLNKQAAEEASLAALAREEKRKALYREWLSSKGLTENQSIDQKVYKEWLEKLKEFNKKFPLPATTKAPTHIYPHAVLLYTDDIPFPLVIDKNPEKKAALPPAFIPLTPFASYTRLSLIAPNFSITQVVEASLLNFPTLEENRTFEAKVIAKNDIEGLGAREEKTGPDAYFMVLAMNLAPQSGLVETTKRRAMVVKYLNDTAQSAVQIEFKERDRLGAKTGGYPALAPTKPSAKNAVDIQPVGQDQIETEWKKFVDVAEQAYGTARPLARSKKKISSRLPSADPTNRLALSLKKLAEG